MLLREHEASCSAPIPLRDPLLSGAMFGPAAFLLESFAANRDSPGMSALCKLLLMLPLSSRYQRQSVRTQISQCFSIVLGWPRWGDRKGLMKLQVTSSQLSCHANLIAGCGLSASIEANMP